MNLEQVTDLILELKLHEPRPVGLWFVDRSALFYWLLKTAVEEINHLAFPYHFYGIPIHHFDPYIATEEQLKVRPGFCRMPGVWVEMSNGDHVRLADDSP